MKPRFEKPIIYLITPGEATDAGFASARDKILTIVRLAVEEKVSLIQLREKSLSARKMFELTTAAAELTYGSETLLLLNDRADIAQAARADGVHLTANSIPAGVIRRNFPAPFVIGVSTHSRAAAEAVSRDADFAVFGPVFETPGKDNVAGLPDLSDVCRGLVPFPIIGLGGIDEQNCKSVLDVGASGIAAIRSLNDPDSLRSIVRKLRNE